MSTKWTVSLLAILLFAPSLFAENQLSNGSFEAGRYGWYLWTEFGLGSRIDVLGEGAKYGTRCMRVERTSGIGLVWLVHEFVALNQGMNYTFSVWLRSDSDSLPVALQMGCYDGVTVGKWNQTSQDVTVGKGWNRYSITWNTPSAAMGMYRPMIKVLAPGALYVDGAQIEQGTMSDFVPKATVEMGLSPNCEESIYHLSDTVELTVLAANSGNTDLVLWVRVTLTDYNDLKLKEETVAMFPAAGMTGQVTLDLTQERLGYYRANVELLNELGGAITSGLWAFGVIPSAPENPDPKFGICMERENIEAQVGLARKLGIGAVRLHNTLLWGNTEKVKGTFTWDDELPAIQSVYEAGMEPLVYLMTVPPWAQSPSNPWMPKDLNDYANMVTQTVNRCKQLMDDWEIVNESSLYYQPSDYLTLLQTAYGAAKGADPNCTVVGISGFTGDATFMPYVLQHGGLNYMDVLSIHPYSVLFSHSTPEDGFPPAWAEVHGLMQQQGQEKPIWSTEFGWRATDWFRLPDFEGAVTDVNEKTQGDYLVRGHVISYACGVERFYYFLLATNIYGGPYTNNIFVGDSLISPKKAVVALAGMTSALSGLDFQERWDVGRANIWAMRFANGSRQVVVAWVPSGVDSFLVSGDTDAIEIHDVAGNEMPKVIDSGFLKVSLSPTPVYIETSASVPIRPGPPLKPEHSIWIEAESATEMDPHFDILPGECAYSKAFLHLETTDLPPSPPGYYSAKIPFSVQIGSGYALSFIGNPLNVAYTSPLWWRIDSGQWQRAWDLPQEGELYTPWPETGGFYKFFGVTRLGTVQLEAGQHVLELRIDETREINPWYTLFADAFALLNQNRAVLTMAVNDPNGGTTSPASGPLTVDCGVPTQITAVPNVGYAFGSWTASPSGNATFGNAGSASTTVTLTGNATVTSNFVPVPICQLTMAANPVAGGKTTPIGTSVRNRDTPVPITATPNPGYGFAGWTASPSGNATFGDSNLASTTVTLSLTATVTANFTEEVANRPPVLNPIGNKTINENVNLNFTVTASDPDGDAITLSDSNLPSGATFSASAGAFSWTPTFSQAGTYPNVTFTATDDGEPPQSDSESITITVTSDDKGPAVNGVSVTPNIFNEGHLDTLEISATVDDTHSGNVPIAGTEWKADDISGSPAGAGTMNAVDGFDQPIEPVTGHIDCSAWLETKSPYKVYVRGKDAAGNWSGWLPAGGLPVTVREGTPPLPVANLQAAKPTGTKTKPIRMQVVGCSSKQPLYPAQNACDNSMKTWWQTAGTSSPQEEWIILDLGDNMWAGQVYLKGNNKYLVPTTFKIRVAEDLEGPWYSMITGWSYPAGTNRRFKMSQSNTAYGRYLLVEGLGNLDVMIGLYAVRFSEISFVGRIHPSTAVMLRWTAPTDQRYGTVSEYDIRFSTSPITEANWDEATEIGYEPVPKRPGAREKLVVRNLPTPETTYYFALKSRDLADNWSALSNVVSYTTAPAQAIGQPRLQQPGDEDEVLAGGPPTFSWDSDVYNLAYAVYFSSGPFFAPEATKVYEVGAEESWIPDAVTWNQIRLLDNKVYWHVRGMNTAGTICFSQVWELH